MKISRKSTLVFILAIIVICMLLAQLFFAIFLLTKNYKKANEIEGEKIPISGFTSINLVNTTTFSRPQYDPLQGNLGLTGKLYLDCYTGTCTYEREGKKRCHYEDDCNWEYYTYYETEINRSCSIECSQTNEAKYSVCQSGKCSKKYNDKYDPNKVCYADNVIYFWKGKSNEALNIGDYDYLNNAYLNNELCPTGAKNCGILDDNKNK